MLDMAPSSRCDCGLEDSVPERGAHPRVPPPTAQAHFTAPSNVRRKLMSSPLSSELRQKYSVSGWNPRVVQGATGGLWESEFGQGAGACYVCVSMTETQAVARELGGYMLWEIS